VPPEPAEPAPGDEPIRQPVLPLATERLALRPFRRGDEADVLAYRSRPEVCRYIPSDPLDEVTAADFITARMDLTKIAADGDRIVLAVELAGQVIGDVLIRTAQLADRQAELGWVLSPDFHGHGYATEAARGLTDACFRDLGMHRVWAALDARNKASARVCERLGMRHEAHLRHDMWLKNEWTDSLIYAILRDEWRPAASQSAG
jgi:RimJ/RimL family protein N-acetyltransferase